MMKKKRFKAYVVPVREMLLSETESLLNSASGNAGTIIPGITGGDAKKKVEWDDEEEDDDEALKDNSFGSYKIYKRDND